MNKKFWKNVYIYEKYKPVLTCPTCDVGLLTLDKNNIKYFETSESLESQSSPDFEFYWTNYRFSAILRCNNPTCKDIVATVGNGSLETDQEFDEDGIPSYSYKTFLRPKYFEPAIKIIPIKDQYPEEIKELLYESFSLFFTDYSSCANKIRKVVEKLMTLKGIKKYRTNSRSPLPLEQRINLFRTRYPKFSHLADQLIAIKWIGNTGSHEGITMSIDNIINAYQILQNCLDYIFIDHSHQATIKKLTKSINKRKGK
jgi:hypothetical protein